MFLGNIRSVDAILHVIRCFENDNVIHVDGNVNPVRDKEIIDFELQLKDLESIDKKIQKTEKLSKTGNKDAIECFEVLTRFKKHIEEGKSARSCPLGELEVKHVEDLQLLTIKPVMYVCNVEEGNVLTGNAHTKALTESVKDENAEIIFISAAIEADIAELESYEDKQAFLADLGLKEPGVNRLIKSAYHLLNLATYFTAGVKEVRAWTIKKGFTAPQAAGVIHTDFEKGFIRAEVIKYIDFITLKSEAACRDAGKLGVQGKEYIVEDGDIMHFRFNV